MESSKIFRAKNKTKSVLFFDNKYDMSNKPSFYSFFQEILSFRFDLFILK